MLPFKIVLQTHFLIMQNVFASRILILLLILLSQHKLGSLLACLISGAAALNNDAVLPPCLLCPQQVASQETTRPIMLCSFHTLALPRLSSNLHHV